MECIWFCHCVAASDNESAQLVRMHSCSCAALNSQHLNAGGMKDLTKKWPEISEEHFRNIQRIIVKDMLSQAGIVLVTVMAHYPELRDPIKVCQIQSLHASRE